MTILVDIDGVIFNTQETLLDWLNLRYDDNYAIDDITSYDWFDKTFEKPWEPMKCELFWYGVKTNQQAIDCILKWKNEGHIIKFVTASYYHYALDTKIHKLLDCFNGEFDDKNVIICHDKSMVRGDILIDDCFDNVCKFIKSGYKQYGILYSQPWNFIQYLANKDNINFRRCDSWEVIDKCVLNLLQNKK